MKTRIPNTKYKDSYFMQYVRNRIFELNKNYICMINGPTGSGKTYAGLKFGEDFDPNFSIENVCFKPLDLTALVMGTSKVVKRGAVILWDEIQVEMGALDFMTATAKAITRIISTFRHRNFVFLITCPNYSDVSKPTRKLLHGVMRTQTIDKKNKKLYLKNYLTSYNDKRDKMYFKFLRILNRETGEVSPLPLMAFGLPSKDLIDKYEEARGKFTSQLNEDIDADIKIKEFEKQKKRDLVKKRISVPTE